MRCPVRASAAQDSQALGVLLTDRFSSSMPSNSIPANRSLLRMAFSESVGLGGAQAGGHPAHEPLVLAQAGEVPHARGVSPTD